MQGHAYKCYQPNGRLDREDTNPVVSAPGDVVVRVAGCGVCHTDLSFYTGQVKTRRGFPIVFGHEISGTVVEAGPEVAHLLGKHVIVPAVMPCGECPVCFAGHDNSCPRQFMPGNDADGGFASHVLVPGRFLTVLPNDLGAYRLEELSVIADAVSTPYQSIHRSSLRPGDLAVVVGAGGIGTHAIQIAAAFGATVLAIDIDDGKLERLKAHGASRVLNVKGMQPSDARKAVRRLAEELGAPTFGWKVYEMSGTSAGQTLAYSILPPAGTLAVVGFTMDMVSLRLSNLMALDATCFGNWGASPKHYPACVELVLSGRVTLKPFVETHPLSSINEIFHAAHAGRLTRRAVLVPEHD